MSDREDNSKTKVNKNAGMCTLLGIFLRVTAWKLIKKQYRWSFARVADQK